MSGPGGPFPGQQPVGGGYAAPSMDGMHHLHHQGGQQMPGAPQGMYQQPMGFQQPGFQQPQQGYSMQQGYGMGPGPQQPGFVGQQEQTPDQAFSIPGLNPLNFMAAGTQLLAGGQGWGQQYVQKVQARMSWLTGGTLNYHFAVSSNYVATKLGMLMAPYLKRWTFTRQQEQIQGAQKFRPPRVDINAPDLYVPLMAAWAYVILVLANAALLGKYKPDMMYSTVWYTGVAWLIHAAVAAALLRSMALPSSVPWVELFAYTGYSFVPACVTLLAGIVAGKWGWRLGYLYGSMCAAVFLVRTMKRIIFQEARSYGPNLTLTNYLLLALAIFQFPFALWLCNVQLPVLSHLAEATPVAAAATAAATGAAEAAKAAGKVGTGFAGRAGGRA